MAPSFAVSSIDELAPVLTVADVAAFLACSEFTVRQLVRTSRIGHVRLGRLIKIPRHDLASFLGCDENRSS